MDNALYHDIKADRCQYPRSSSNKNQIINWLTERGVPVNDAMTKVSYCMHECRSGFLYLMFCSVFHKTVLLNFTSPHLKPPHLTTPHPTSLHFTVLLKVQSYIVLYGHIKCKLKAKTFFVYLWVDNELNFTHTYISTYT